MPGFFDTITNFAKDTWDNLWDDGSPSGNTGGAGNGQGFAGEARNNPSPERPAPLGVDPSLWRAQRNAVQQRPDPNPFGTSAYQDPNPFGVTPLGKQTTGRVQGQGQGQEQERVFDYKPERTVSEILSDNLNPNKMTTTDVIKNLTLYSLGGPALLAYGVAGKIGADLIDNYVDPAVDQAIDYVDNQVDEFTTSLDGVSLLKAENKQGQAVARAGLPEPETSLDGTSMLSNKPKQLRMRMRPESQYVSDVTDSPQFNNESFNFAGEQRTGQVQVQGLSQPQPQQQQIQQQHYFDNEGNDNMPLKDIGKAVLGTYAIGKLGGLMGSRSSASGVDGQYDRNYDNTNIKGGYENLTQKGSGTQQSLSNALLAGGERTALNRMQLNASRNNRLAQALANNATGSGVDFRNQLLRTVQSEMGMLGGTLGSTRNTVFQQALVQGAADAEVAFKKWQTQAQANALKSINESQAVTNQLIQSLKGGRTSAQESKKRSGYNVGGGFESGVGPKPKE